MGTIDKTDFIPTPKLDKVDLTSFSLVYDEDMDTLFVRPATAVPAVSIDLGGEMWLRYDPKELTVVGLEVEDFEQVFLKKHPEIAVAWKEINKKGFILRKRHTKNEPFLLILMEFILSFVRNNPTQLRFRPT